MSNATPIVAEENRRAVAPPRPLPAVAALVRAVAQGEGDLLALLPGKAYQVEAGWLGWSRRSILIVNKPEWVRAVLQDEEGVFPKSDLMVGALEPLIGQSIFVSSGETWRRQRRMVAPAFSQLRLADAFDRINAAIADYETRLADMAASGDGFSLDLAMSHLTADVICRTVFSTSLDSAAAQEVFEDFKVFERSVAHVEMRRLIFDPPFKDIEQSPQVLEACQRIRRHLLALVQSHLAADAAFNDIASDMIAAVDPETGARFSDDELVDQLGVFFLAGHETTASALTWSFFMLASRPKMLARLRAEIEEVTQGRPLAFDHVSKLSFAQNIVKEALRLYPPITFLPRVAERPTQIGPYRLRRGAMVMIAPWALHRHRMYWKDPDAFDPDRFSPERAGELTAGAYIPFGQGKRVCVGANFAAVESAMILARLARRFDFSVLNPEAVRPVARLTTRSEIEIQCKVVQR
ncbi:MAG: cytochrome P450 [Pseudomonadota bacterium]